MTHKSQKFIALGAFLAAITASAAPKLLCPEFLRPEEYSLQARYIGENIDEASLEQSLKKYTCFVRMGDGGFLFDRFSDENKLRFLDELKRDLVSMGYEPYVEEFDSTIPLEKGLQKTGDELWAEVKHSPKNAEKEYRRGHNMVIDIKGGNPDAPYLEVSAHYDTTGGMRPGADDNGSGVVTALQIAHLLKRYPPERNVRIIFPDFEELGFQGTRAHVKLLNDRNEKIEGAIVIDMIGYFPTHAPRGEVPSLVVEIGSSRHFGHDAEHETLQTNWSLGQSMLYHQVRFGDASKLNVRAETKNAMPRTADHGPYWAAEHPAVLIAAPFDHDVINPHYHKETDTHLTMNWDYFRSTSRFSIESVMFLTGAKVTGEESTKFATESARLSQHINDDANPEVWFFSPK